MHMPFRQAGLCGVHGAALACWRLEAFIFVRYLCVQRRGGALHQVPGPAAGLFTSASVENWTLFNTASAGHCLLLKLTGDWSKQRGNRPAMPDW